MPLFITEYAGMFAGSPAAQVAPASFLTSSTVAIGGGSLASSAFGPSTRMVRLARRRRLLHRFRFRSGRGRHRAAAWPPARPNISPSNPARRSRQSRSREMAFGALGRVLLQAGIAVRPPVVASGAPANTVAPAVTPVGPSASGTLLSRTTGTWTNTPLSYIYQWRADGANVGTNSASYTTQTARSRQADRLPGHRDQCERFWPEGFQYPHLRRRAGDLGRAGDHWQRLERRRPHRQHRHLDERPAGLHLPLEPRRLADPLRHCVELHAGGR